MQVVRVSADDLLVGEVVFYPEDVIELTEELGPPFEMRDHDEGASHRWISGWEVIDGV